MGQTRNYSSVATPQAITALVKKMGGRTRLANALDLSSCSIGLYMAGGPQKSQLTKTKLIDLFKEHGLSRKTGLPIPAKSAPISKALPEPAPPAPQEQMPLCDGEDAIKIATDVLRKLPPVRKKAVIALLLESL